MTTNEKQCLRVLMCRKAVSQSINCSIATKVTKGAVYCAAIERCTRDAISMHATPHGVPLFPLPRGRTIRFQRCILPSIEQLTRLQFVDSCSGRATYSRCCWPLLLIQQLQLFRPHCDILKVHRPWTPYMVAILRRNSFVCFSKDNET